jgi:hypothetical protein
MSDLHAFQAAFAHALTRGMPSGHYSALARALTIHRNTSFKAARDAMADNYPVVRSLTGAAAFDACAAAFVGAHPPRQSRLCHYGDGFDGFLADYTPFADLPYLPDVARLERLVVESLFAADADALDALALSGGLGLEQTLKPHPATRSGHFDVPAADIWAAHQDGADVEALGRLNWRAQSVLVTRPAHAVLVTAVQPAALAFLQACASGHSLGLAARAAEDADVAMIFSTFLTAGAFASPADPRTKP